MGKKIKVKGESNLVRDTKSKAIINNNIEDRRKKLMKKQFLLKLRKDIDSILERLSSIEDKLKETDNETTKKTV